MPIRDIFTFLVSFGCLPYAFQKPFIGLLVFTWLAYMRPQDLCWSFARTMRFSYFVSFVMLLGFFANELGRRRFAIWDGRSFCMVGLVLAMTISLALANGQTDYVIERYIEFVKIILVALFTSGQVDSRLRLKTILWTIALSLGFFGIKGGIHGVLSGGAPIIRGPGGMLEDNNDFSLALVMNLPLLLYLGQAEDNKWIRRGCTAGMVLTCITILLTHSRGGFLSMCAVMLVFLMRSKKWWVGLLSVGAGVLAFFLFAPEHVIERIALIGRGTEESSAGARWVAWRIAYRMIVAYPVWGVGLRNFRLEWKNFAEGITAPEGFAYVAHNSYLEIWAEGGTVAFALYAALLIGTWITVRRLRNLAKGHPKRDWIFNYARMLEASGMGFVIGSTFLNRGHFDLLYHLLAIVSSFVYVARKEIAGEAAAPVLAEGEAAPAIVRPPSGRQEPIGTWARGRPDGAVTWDAAPGAPTPRWGR